MEKRQTDQIYQLNVVFSLTPPIKLCIFQKSAKKNNCSQNEPDLKIGSLLLVWKNVSEYGAF